MKKVFLLSIGLTLCCVVSAQEKQTPEKSAAVSSVCDIAQTPQQGMSDADAYQQKWYQSEGQYAKEFNSKAEKARKEAYAKMYFDLGKQYYFSKDYPAAMVCFRKAIASEEGTDGQYTSLANKFLAQIKERLPDQIEKQYSVAYGKDFARFQEGVDKILTQHPSSAELAGLTPQEQAQANLPDDVLTMQQDVKDTQAGLEANKEKMRLQLQKEILKAKQEIEKIIFEEKTRQVQDQLKAEQMTPELKRLYESKEYLPALNKAEEILKLDPRNPDAARIKQTVEQIMQEEALRKQRAQEEQLRKEAEEKARIAALIAARIKEIKTDLFNEQFQPASEKIKEVLALDPENKEVFELKKELKRKVKALTDNLLAL